VQKENIVQRINITLEEVTAEVLANIAKHEKRSISFLANKLILEALEQREDLALSKIAKVRDVKGAKTVTQI
jgi:hypothetical protein